MHEGPTYEDHLKLLVKDGVFPPCRSGLTRPACFDLQKLIEYAFARVGRESDGCRVGRAVVGRIDREHIEPCLMKYVEEWAKRESNLRFLQWLICQELKMAPSATSAHLQTDVIDYLSMKLTGQEFLAPA